jgi:hypothetical protein
MPKAEYAETLPDNGFATHGFDSDKQEPFVMAAFWQENQI